MHLLRTATTVVLIAFIAAWWLVDTAPKPPSTRASVVGFVVPPEVEMGERLEILGTVVVPDASTLNMLLRQCDLERPRCTNIGRNIVIGPSTWNGTLGLLRTGEEGSYRVEWTLFADWSPDSRRAVLRMEEEVVVRERVQ